LNLFSVPDATGQGATPQIAGASCPGTRTDAARLPRSQWRRIRALGIVILGQVSSANAGMRQLMAISLSPPTWAIGFNYASTISDSKLVTNAATSLRSGSGTSNALSVPDRQRMKAA